MNTCSTEILQATVDLRDSINHLQFTGSVFLTYNPLDYAWHPHEQYVTKYGNSPKKHLFLGMNPGPFGMAQTGIPFGEINAVVNWLHILAPVNKPEYMHPKRPIQGFACTKSEVSGRRLWGLFAEIFGDAQTFFANNYVINYCPLVWMSESGANITPDKLNAQTRVDIDSICMQYLKKHIQVLRPSTLIGIGNYATQKLQQVANYFPTEQFTIGTLMHPSPASPAANKLWPQHPYEQLVELGVI